MCPTMNFQLTFVELTFVTAPVRDKFHAGDFSANLSISPVVLSTDRKVPPDTELRAPCRKRPRNWMCLY
jgi:hypothetical protein